MKAYWGSGRIAPCILEVGEVSGQFQEAGWAPEPVWTRW
jgi:hypothetical protein